jgi:hypothetical protein
MRQVTGLFSKQSRFERRLSNLIVDLRLWSESLPEDMEMSNVNCTRQGFHKRMIGFGTSIKDKLVNIN